jgi:hypothetical protein
MSHMQSVQGHLPKQWFTCDSGAKTSLLCIPAAVSLMKPSNVPSRTRMEFFYHQRIHVVVTAQD